MSGKNPKKSSGRKGEPGKPAAPYPGGGRELKEDQANHKAAPGRRVRPEAAGAPGAVRADRDRTIEPGVGPDPASTVVPVKATPGALEKEAGTEGKRVEKWELSRFKPHPRQDANFHPLSDQGLRQLADDLSRNGQTTPVEALPDGTLVCGHQRLRAAALLGWTHLTVWVRGDLAGDGYAAEQRMIDDNRARRQLDMLDQVRSAKRLVEVKRRKPPGGIPVYEMPDLRDAIALELGGKSGRNIQRYLNVLKATMDVQCLVQAGKLRLTLAEKVADLPQAAQGRIVREVEAGGDPEEVIAPHLPGAGPVRPNADKMYDTLFRAVDAALEAMGSRVDEVRLPGGDAAVREHINKLKRGAALLTKLADHHRASREEVRREMKKLTSRSKRLREHPDEW